MYKKMLVPLDGSALSETSLKHAVALAKGCQIAEIILLRAREPMDTGVRQRLSADLAAKLDEAYDDETREYLAGIAGYLEGQGVPSTSVAVAGTPAESILNYAKQNAVDIIIMSSHGRTGIARWAFGSVAEKVLKLSEVPVLVIPHKSI